MRFFLLAIVTQTALFAPINAEAETPGFGLAAPFSPAEYAVERIAQGLDTPWDITWLPNGDTLITERAGNLRLMRGGELMTTPIEGVPLVYASSQAGLFEVTPHPRFEENGWIYLSYAHGTKRKNTLRLARAQYVPTPNGAKLKNLTVLFEADAYRNSAAHYGGRFVFLADETLLLTSGEGYAFRHEAQKLDSHFGKTLRLTDSGEAAADNPFVNIEGALPEIWSYGHRNHQGIAVASDGTVYSNEHGARGGDEVNVIAAGLNFGWPLVTWGVDYSGSQISPYTETDGTFQPILYWTPSIAPSALMYYDGDVFPEWRGLLFSSALATREIRVIDPAAPNAKQFSLLTELDVRIRDVSMGPDGYIYALTEGARGGEVLQIKPAT